MEEVLVSRFEGTLEYTKTQQLSLCEEEIKGLEQDLLLLLAQIRGEN